MGELKKPFRIQHQEQDQWCWAAVTASVCVFYEDAAHQQQCGLANHFLETVRGGTDCCSDGSSDDCNVPFGLADALRELGRLNPPVRGPLTFQDLGQQIEANRPIGVRIQLADFSAHFIVVTACEETSDGRQWVKIADPGGVAGNVVTLEYEELVSNFRPGATWDESYLTN